MRTAEKQSLPGTLISLRVYNVGKSGDISERRQTHAEVPSFICVKRLEAFFGFFVRVGLVCFAAPQELEDWNRGCK